MSDRAVSNTLGYVLLFAVVLTSVVTVATLGFDSLTSARDTTVTMNAEDSMVGLAGSVDDVNTHNLSARTSVFRMGSGTLETADTTEVSVAVDGSTVVDADVDPIQYRFRDTELVHSLGAVFRQQGDGSRVVEEPTFLFDSEAVIVPVLVTTADEPGRSVGGSTSVVYFQRTDRVLAERVVDSAGSVTVDIEITTTEQRAGLWKEALEDEMDTCSITGGGDTVACEFDTDPGASIVVRQTDVTYELST